MARRLYGEPVSQWGAVIAGISVKSHQQARLLEEMLSRELRERAGKPEETILAKWNNELVRLRRKAVEQEWIGWGDGA
jgi:hypothetical protein